MKFSYKLDDIKQAVQKAWDFGSDKKVWAFHGEMGTGKTTFIHALCEALGVTSAIGSPTYSIINEYATEKYGIIYHMDWYRLKDEEEALQAGVEDCLYSGSLCLVEWPEKAPALIPEEHLDIYIQLLDEQTRELRVDINH
jgi:tRNA threonylcarbamoyladenosine biosynthesis protein TsaE